MTSTRHNLPRHFWLFAPIAVAMLCVGFGFAFESSEWARFFEHESRTSLNDGIIVEQTIQGAMLWRSMLFVAAAALTIAPLLLLKITRSASSLDRSPAQPMTSREVIWLSGFCVLGLLIRATRLNESLWYDELAPFLSYALHGPGAIVGNYFDPSNQIAHTLLTWLSTASIGVVSELTLRLPALFFSIASIAAIYGFARQTAGSRIAMLAAALSAILPVMVLEGVEARSYSMMIFFAAASTWVFLGAWENERAVLWVLYAGLCALGVWSHLVTVCVPIGHGVYTAWRCVRHGRCTQTAAAVVSLIFAAVLTVTLYAPVLPDILNRTSEFQRVQGDEPVVFGPEGWHALLQLGGSWYWWAALPGLVPAVLGWVEARQDHRLRTALIVSWLGVVVLIGLVLLGDSWTYARFFLFAMPGAVLAIAAGFDRLWRRKSTLACLAGGVLILASGTELAIRPQRQPLRDAVAYVANHRTRDERVGSVGLGAGVLTFYTNGAGFDAADSGVHGRQLQQMLNHANPQWIILYYPESVSRETYDLLKDRGYALHKRFAGWIDWGKGDVFIYHKD